MKNIFLLTLLFLCLLSAYAQTQDKKDYDRGIRDESEQDGPIIVYLEKNDSLLFNWSVVFENVTADTIAMSNKFKDFRGDALVNNGFNVTTYRNREGFVQARSEPQIYFYIDNEHTIGRVATIVHPYSKAKLNFSLNQFCSISPEKRDEIGVQFFIRFTYLKYDEEQPKHVRAVTNYLQLDECQKH